jgi:enterochelin esterase-like enzyme
VWRPNVEVFERAVTDRGIELTWQMFPGQHESEYWIEHVPDYVRFYAEALRSDDTGLQL